MRRLFVLVCGVALLSAAPLPAQAPHAKDSSQQAILPEQFAAWKSGSPSASVLWPPGQGAAIVGQGIVDGRLLKESGAVRAEQRAYENGSAEVTIRAFQLADPSSAYEVFTSLLKPGMVPTHLGQAAEFDKEGVIVQEGSLVLASSANVSKDDLSALLKAVEGRGEKGPLPPIRTYLPAQGRVVGTERYALGPDALKAALEELEQTNPAGLVAKAGFSEGAEAMVARYTLPGPAKDSGVLLLLEYPTPQLAEQHIHHLDEVLPASVKQGGTGILRKGSLLSLVLSASSPEYAKALREDTDYQTQVTWNEPSATATDPPWAVVLARIFMGTAVFMVAAVVLGIAFGGVRVLTKIFFPGKVFDRPGQIEILQLGLSGKPINTKDFY